MKKLFLVSVGVAFLAVLSSAPLYARVLNCPCGYDGADCIPCKQQEEDIKEVPKIDSKRFKNCRCGLDAASDECVPCGESDYDKTERNMDKDKDKENQ